MSTAEILSLISLISFIVAGVCLVLTLFFWFKFRIPKVIGDLSGRTAKKSIERMRESNEKSGVKSYRSSAVNLERGKLTESMSGINKENGKGSVKKNKMPETGVLSENRAKTYHGNETVMLEGMETTELLNDEGTELLEETVREKPQRYGGKKMVILDEVMLIHTDEVIE